MPGIMLEVKIEYIFKKQYFRVVPILTATYLKAFIGLAVGLAFIPGYRTPGLWLGVGLEVKI